MITLKDIAEVSGVHYSTVAGILNQSAGNSRWSDATRTRVEETARKLGYTRNETARAMRRQRTQTVGFLAGDVRTPFFAAMATAVEQNLCDAGYRLLLSSYGEQRAWPNVATKAKMINDLIGQSVDSIIVWTEGSVQKVMKDVRVRADRIVWLGTPDSGACRIEVDLRCGLEMIVQYLVKHGHRHVTYYGPEGECAPRFAKFHALALAAGIEVEPFWFQGSGWDIAAASQGAAMVHRPGEGVVVGYGDVAALGWWTAHPHDKVIGFDGSDWFRSILPTMPTVDLRVRDIAAMAAEQALRLADQSETKPCFHEKITPLWRS